MLKEKYKTWHHPWHMELSEPHVFWLCLITKSFGISQLVPIPLSTPDFLKELVQAVNSSIS